MVDTKLFYILSAFDRYEVQRFRKYIASPFFNEQPDLVHLYSAILDNWKSGLEKEKIWLYVFGNTNFNDVKFRRLCSDLSKLAENFLAYKAYEKDEVQQKNNLANIILERNLGKLENDIITSIDKKIAEETTKNAKFYFNSLRLSELKKRLFDRHFLRNNQADVSEVLQNLDYYYIIEKLKSYCEFLNYKQVMYIGTQNEVLFMEHILSYLELNIENMPIAIQIPYYAVRLFEQKNEQIYHTTKKLLEDNYTVFAPSELRIFFGFLQNYCISCINKGETNFLNELFGIYQFILETEIILDGNLISPWDYKNIVVTGLRISEQKWVKNFIEKYKSHLPEKFRENAYTYNLAKYFFYKKEYEKVIELLQNVEYEDVFYALDSKSMLLKVFYEKKEFAALDSLLESFSKFLNRKKLAPNHKISYYNLLKFTKKMFNLYPRHRRSLEALRLSIQQTKQVADINWLFTKIDEEIKTMK